jgi:cell division protein FtsL
MEFRLFPSLSGTGASRRRALRAQSRAVSGKCARATRSSERGAGNFKAIIWTAVLVAFVYIGVMVIPVLINEYEFQDSLQDIARFASVNRKSNEQVKQAVMEEAQKEDLPVQAEDVKVEGAQGNVHINVNYAVTVDLKVYQWTLNFHPDASNKPLF